MNHVVYKSHLNDLMLRRSMTNTILGHFCSAIVSVVSANQRSTQHCACCLLITSICVHWPLLSDVMYHCLMILCIDRFLCLINWRYGSWLDCEKYFKCFTNCYIQAHMCENSLPCVKLVLYFAALKTLNERN